MIRNNITIPESILCQIDTSLAKIVFTTDNIANIIKNLDLNKCKPHEVIFATCLNHGDFPKELKKTNFVPVFKKATNNVLKELSPCIYATKL